jgi:hypothetical protein
MHLNSNNSRRSRPLGWAVLLALFAVLPARADYQSTVVGQAPVGYWRLNETTTPTPNGTTANYGSLAGTIGTYNGAPTHHLPGPFTGSYAVGLSGSAQSVTTPYQDALNPSSFSVELWAQPASSSYFGYIASSVYLTSPRQGWYFAQDNGGTFGAGNAFVLRLFNTNATTTSLQLSAPVTAANVWYHLVITYDSVANLASLYTNGVLAMSGTPALNGAGLGYVPNTSVQSSFGCRADNAYYWPGNMAEPAYYNGALSAGRVAAHYAAATSVATYNAAVQADAPVLWYQFPEAADVAAANSGTLGSVADGKYPVGTSPGAVGPRQPTYPGFEVNNYAVSVPGNGPSVSVPALNLNTNTVTITGWIKPANVAQSAFAGVIMCDAGSTYSGLNLDANGTGIGYTWANDANTYNWIPSTDSGLPLLVPSDWNYVALVVNSAQAAIYLCASNNPANFMGVTNNPPGGHVMQKFDGVTLFGSDANASAGAFNGLIDEVTIFNRALGEGEIYSQYATSVGGLKPLIFNELLGPAAPVAAGDPIDLIVDAGGTTPLTFVWSRGGTPFATNSTPTLTIGTSTLGDSGNYTVQISNALGSTNSQPVAVTVVTPSVPQIQKIDGYLSRTLYPTGTLSFAVSATGGGLKYQWYKNTSPIASATASSYTVARVTTNDAGSYSLRVTNIVGTTTSGPPAIIAIPTVAAGSYEAAMITSAPEAWWRLDEPAGSTNMFDGMGRHNGFYTNAAGGATLPTLGVTGALVNDANTAASFSSAGQGVGFAPYSPALNASQQTYEAWVKTSVLDGQSPFSSTYGGNGMWCQTISGWWYGDCSGGYWGNNGNVNTNGAIIPGYWSYVVMIYDPVSNSSYPFKLYVNGQTDGYIWGGVPVNNSGPFIIGARGAGSSTSSILADRFFDGQVDEVAVYQRVLSGTEITAHMAARGVVIIPASFSTPLLSQTVTTGKSISFSTSVLGTSPISLQWYKDGTKLNNQTNSSYSIASTALGDTGVYTLWATNAGATNSISASLSVYSPFYYANVTNNLVLHLRMDGDGTDSSGHGNNATLSSSPAPTFPPGIIGSGSMESITTTINDQSLSNVTSASYASIGTAGSGPPADLRFGASTSFSVSVWVKEPAGSLTGDLPFIGTQTNSANNPGWGLTPDYKTGGWQWGLNDGANNVGATGTANPINDGNWHSFILTVDRTAAVADSYVDGIHTASKSIAGLGSIDNNNYWPIAIGQDPTFLYKEPGTNIVDDIGIWRRALTPLEVTQIASAGSTSGRSFDTVGPATVIISATPAAGGNVVLGYSQGTLLQSTNVAPGAVWTPVPGANPPSYTVPATGNGKFYRVLVQ